MTSYIDRTRPLRVSVDMGIALRCACYLPTESWELHLAEAATKLVAASGE